MKDLFTKLGALQTKRGIGWTITLFPDGKLALNCAGEQVFETYNLQEMYDCMYNVERKIPKQVDHETYECPSCLQSSVEVTRDGYFCNDIRCNWEMKL